MKITVALVALLVAGCATAPPQSAVQYRWVKIGIGQEDAARDAVQCRQYGSQFAAQKMRMGDQGPHYDERVAVASSPLAAYEQAAIHDCLAELGYQLVPIDAFVAR